MPAILAFLLKPSSLGLLAFLGVLAFGGIQTWRISSLHKDLTIAQAQTQAVRRDLQTCQANVASESAALSRQSAAVLALQAQSLADTQKATKAAQTASRASETASKLASQVLAPHVDHSCSAADALIKGSLP